MVKLLLLDAALLGMLVIGTSVFLGKIATVIESRVGLSASVARMLGLGLAVVLALPFCVGVVRLARALGVLLAETALPPAAPEGRVDLAAAPRRALVVTLQLASVLAVGAPLVAITQPFLRGFQGAAVLLVLLVVLGVGFWRSATNLQGHVRAGSQVIVEALATQSRGKSEERPGEPLRDIHQILPGLGEPTPVRLEDSSPAVGRSLAELNLRGMTGATVLAIRRGEAGAIIPTAHETLRGGDVLALAGTHEAIDAARAVLEGTARQEPAAS
jgi:CPA2 family monovalent cation:H+ antiporter-2